MADSPAPDRGAHASQVEAALGVLTLTLRSVRRQAEDVAADRVDSIVKGVISGGAPQDDEPAERAYWRFDARRKGYSDWDGAPMSERDAFKAEYRAMQAERDEWAALKDDIGRDLSLALDRATRAEALAEKLGNNLKSAADMGAELARLRGEAA